MKNEKIEKQNDLGKLLEGTRAVNEAGYQIDTENKLRAEVADLIGHLVTSGKSGDEVSDYILRLVHDELQVVRY